MTILWRNELKWPVKMEPRPKQSSDIPKETTDTEDLDLLEVRDEEEVFEYFDSVPPLSDRHSER